VDGIRILVRSDQRSRVRLLAEELNMNKETVGQIITPYSPDLAPCNFLLFPK
jgi:hypothetical protein